MFAVTVSGAGVSAPATDSGYRGVGPLEYLWQRSASDADSGYTALAGATGPTHFDTTAPASGEGRYYRLVVSAAGASPKTSSADRGYRGTSTGTISATPRTDLWVTNGHVSAVAESLGTLYLGGTDVSDASVKTLAGFKKLRWLELVAARVTPKGYQELRKALPAATIPYRYWPR